MLSVKFGNTDIIDTNSYPLSLFQNNQEPKLTFTKFKDSYYCIMIIDKDAPNKTNPINKYFLHWLIVNNNEEIIKYMAPSPPKNSGPHRYYVCVYKQNERIRDIKIDKRQKFSPKDFKQKYGLNMGFCKMFITESI